MIAVGVRREVAQAVLIRHLENVLRQVSLAFPTNRATYTWQEPAKTRLMEMSALLVESEGFIVF